MSIGLLYPLVKCCVNILRSTREPNEVSHAPDFRVHRRVGLRSTLAPAKLIFSVRDSELAGHDWSGSRKTPEIGEHSHQPENAEKNGKFDYVGRLVFRQP